jgi:hypothetical protein
MDIVEEIKQTYKFEWEEKKLPPPGVEIDPPEALYTMLGIMDDWIDWWITALKGYTFCVSCNGFLSPLVLPS